MKVDLDLWVWCEGIKAGARGAKMRASRFIVRGLCLEDRALRTERERDIRTLWEQYAEWNAELQAENADLNDQVSELQRNALQMNERIIQCKKEFGDNIKLFESIAHGCLMVMWKNRAGHLSLYAKSNLDKVLEQYTTDVLYGLKATEDWQRQDKQRYNDRWCDHEQTIVDCVKRLYESQVLYPTWYSVNDWIHVLTQSPSWNDKHLWYVVTLVSSHAEQAWQKYQDLPQPRPDPQKAKQDITQKVLQDFWNQYEYESESWTTNRKKKWTRFGGALVNCWWDSKNEKRKRWNVQNMHHEYVTHY